MGSGFNDPNAERVLSGQFTAGNAIEVTVVFTSRQGTEAALEVAGNLVKDLGARIRLVVAQVYRPPRGKPVLCHDLLGCDLFCLVCDLGIQAEEVLIEKIFCRSRMECLRKSLRPRSLVVLGGHLCRWNSWEQRLATMLRADGHDIIFAGLARGPKVNGALARNR